MRRDEDWYDAVGKDQWRWDKELKQIEKEKAQNDKTNTERTSDIRHDNNASLRERGNC